MHPPTPRILLTGTIILVRQITTSISVVTAFLVPRNAIVLHPAVMQPRVFYNAYIGRRDESLSEAPFPRCDQGTPQLAPFFYMCSYISPITSSCAFFSFVSFLYLDIFARQFFLHRGCHHARTLACRGISPRRTLV
ncbi:hypothetical protein EDD18DRAFT_673235 [Armillaria luteobubalina]|uniref:Uncharacterized protein n=1 Tax=Armillaria luteobubalina TaxID=153913 RepID=A0AA39UDV2_9AGAR|nr:hypothetical protein EDD18DRAFT_673235 [Armillaria luteobubalina]